MTRDEAILILGVFRCGKDDASDPFFAEALKLASEDGDLAKWFTAEQAFDAKVTASLAHGEAPAALKAALLAAMEPLAQRHRRPHRTLTFPHALALAAACAVAAALLTFSFMRPRAESGGQVADFRAEMVAFLLPPPPLTLETSDLAQIQSWVARNGAATDVRVPAKTQQLRPLGCRILIFRGHKVGLLCFQRAGGKIVHLLVVDRAAIGGGSFAGERLYQQEGEWMTAAWVEEDKFYLLAAQGGREQLENFL